MSATPAQKTPSASSTITCINMNAFAIQDMMEMDTIVLKETFLALMKIFAMNTLPVLIVKYLRSLYAIARKGTKEMANSVT